MFPKLTEIHDDIYNFSSGSLIVSWGGRNRFPTSEVSFDEYWNGTMEGAGRPAFGRVVRLKRLLGPSCVADIYFMLV